MEKLDNLKIVNSIYYLLRKDKIFPGTKCMTGFIMWDLTQCIDGQCS